MEQKVRVETLGYSGIFLSCFSNDNTSCIHANKDHSLIYLYSGEYLIDEDGTQTIVHPGECAFIRRDHRTTMYKKPSGTEQYKGITLVFKRNLLREFYNTKLNKNDIPKSVSDPGKSVFRIESRPDITSLFQSLTPYFDSGIQPTEEVIQLKLQEGIYSLLNTDKQFYPILFDFTEPWKIDIMEFLNENYMYDLTMEDIATYTGRSLATFKRDFSKISSVTPQKWLINKRLQVAHDKLINEHRKASDVYMEVGFKNLSHFYSAYKKQFGYSPANKHLT
ncbi:MAG: helix-turn-helix domain-containing protein [Dysgonomonas sp.]